jgi:hypothetical protein
MVSYVVPLRSPSRREAHVLEMLGAEMRPYLLWGQVIVPFVAYMAFTRTVKIGPRPDMEDYLDQLWGILKKVGWMTLAMCALFRAPKTTPVDWSAFLFAESIGGVYLVVMITVAAQNALLLKYAALFEPEQAWEKIGKLEGLRLVVWHVSFGLLVNPMFVNAPRELLSNSLWIDSFRDSQNRTLDRKMGRYVSPFNRNAEVHLDAVFEAQQRRGAITLCGFGVVLILLIAGLATTEWLRRRDQGV